ncbi:unknown [Prevotella sp. CAG:755]|nr:unknown [Prevotella sp. CAG:755]
MVLPKGAAKLQIFSTTGAAGGAFFRPKGERVAGYRVNKQVQY